MAKRRRCVWLKNRIYQGKHGGKRRVLSVSRYNMIVEIIAKGGSDYYAVGSHIQVKPASMIRWTKNSSKTIELVEGVK